MFRYPAPNARPPTMQPTTGPTPPQKLIRVSVIVKRKNHLDLAALGGRIISREEFNEKYAADPADFDKVRKFAHDHGLTVDEGASSLAAADDRPSGHSGRLSRQPSASNCTTTSARVTISTPSKEGFRCRREHADVIENVLGLDARPVANAPPSIQR